MNSPLDNLTVCVTSFRRARYLERALRSLRAAGIRRVTVAAVSFDPDTRKVIYDEDHDWLSFDVACLRDDIGCNATWILAAYLARTDRIIVLHDDDVLLPAFGAHYVGLLAPMLDAGVAGFVTWEACHYRDDGTTTPCRFFGDRSSGPRPSTDLLEIVGRFGRLSLSPVVSVLDRDTTIAACKEAEQTLTGNECLHRPGMLLGTEVLVYLRHIGRFPGWFYDREILSGYGYHAGSGTVQAQAEKDGEARLALGYDAARRQAGNPPPPLVPRILLVWSHMMPKDWEEEDRFEAAMMSWLHLFGTGLFIPFPVGTDRAPDSAVGVPFVKAVIGAAIAHARPEDIVLYVNRDNGLTTHAYERILDGIACGRGACACPRRDLRHPEPGRLYRSVRNCRTTGGYDAFAFTPAWWSKHAGEFPDMLIGREAWDTVLRTLMHEVAIGRRIEQDLEVTNFDDSPACCDDVVWHAEHFSRWQVDREKNPGNIHNVALAQRFYRDRGIAFLTYAPPPTTG